VSVAVKITGLTHVPKVETSLPNVRYVMKITQQIIADVLFFKKLQQLRTKQPPSKSNTNKTEENTNCKNPTLYNPPLNSTSHPNNSSKSQTYSQATLQNKNPIYTNNEHQNQQNENISTQLTSLLNEFKSLINPLISLLTTVIDKLIIKNVN